ncbi:MAG: penicillin-binding protein 2 [Bradymonadales bacterium]
MKNLLRHKKQKSAKKVAEIRTDPKDYARSFRIVFVFVAIPFIFLSLRFWYLQIWKEEHYKQLAFNNFIKRRVIPAERGVITDIEGRLVAENRPAYNVALTPAFFVQSGESEEEVVERIQRLAKILSLSSEQIEKLTNNVLNVKPENKFSPIPIKQDITRDQVALVETNMLDFYGVEITATSRRYYPFNDLAAHLIGYVNEVNGEELQKLNMYGYRLGDVTGRMGIERAFEPILRGSSGLSAMVVNARGMPQTDPASLGLMRNWKDVAPIAGKTIVLTVDMDLQRILKNALRNFETGAIVAMDPNSGRILGIASTPTFNPNSWSGRLSRDEHLKSDTNPYKPMLDKALLSYFPGSVYKVITAVATLEEGLMQTHDTLNCPGYYEYGKQRRRFHCWKHSGHGAVNIVESLGASCDVYFYKVGEKLGMDTLAEYAYHFGLGRRTGIGINGESPGLVPTRAWHAKHSSEGFQGGFTLSTSIGQGDTRTTPLQMALLYSALANGGTLYYPQIVDRIETAQGEPLFEYPLRVRSKLPYKASTLKAIRDGLDMVMNAEIGTAYAYRLPYLNVAAKTGTAQVTSRRSSNAAVEFKYRDHAWFITFAPIDNAEIVVVVFLEHGGSGSSSAGPVAMEVLDRYFREIKKKTPAVIEQNTGFAAN